MTEALLSDTPGTTRRTRGPGLRGLVVVLAVLLIAGGLLVAVLMGWVMPKKYESTVVIQVLGGRLETENFQVKPSTEMMDAEARRVVGVATFDRVRERLQLEKRWDADEKEVTEMLRQAVKAEVREGTDLIEITARHSSPGDARDVAMGLAEEYGDLRKEEEIRKAQMALDALDAELKVQEDKVEEKRRMLDELLEGSGMSIDEAVEKAVEKQAIHRSEEKSLLELHAEGHHLDEIVRDLGKLRGPELFRFAASLELPQNTAAILWTGYETLLVESEELREGGFGEGHPQVVAKELQLSMLKDDLDRAIKQMRDVTVDQRKYLEVRKNALEQSYDRRRLVLRSLQIESSAYLKAKRSYWDELALLESLKSRHGSVRGRMEMLTVLVAVEVEADP